MTGKRFFSLNYAIFIVICLSVIQIKTCQSQVLSSFLREVLGLSNSYRTIGNVVQRHEACEHVLPMRRRTTIKDFDLKKFAGCLKETTNYGTIALPRDYGKRADQVIRDHGYNLVIYDNITSVDGYIQSIYRITGSPISPPRKGKTAVLLIHGAMSGIDSFFLLGNNSLPFKLADNGYDVWMPNNRGTDYSQGHVKYNLYNDLEYWDFSHHEIAMYDVPMYIDFVLNKTEQEKIFYIGYSVGAMVYPATLAEMPEYNDKILAAFLYGAGVFIGQAKSPAKIATFLLDLPYGVQASLNWVLHGNAAGRLAFVLARLGAIFCNANAVTCGLCGTMVGVSSMDAAQMNYTRIPDVMTRTLNSISVKYWIHLAQNYRSCKFQKFDYGPEKNIKLYGQPNAPSYKLRNVRAPTYIYYGSHDTMVVLKDLKKFEAELAPGTVKGYRVSPWKGSDHFDFIMANDAPTLFYDKILDDMKEYL